MAELKPGEFLRRRSREDRDAYFASAARAGLISPEVADSMIAAARRADLDSPPPIDGPTDCRGEPLDLGPATRADLAELDAVPEPVDSDAPREVHQRRRAQTGPTGDIARCPVHGRAGFCNELAWAADGVLLDEYPTREAVEQALRDRHIDLSEVRLSTAKCGWTSDA